MPYVGHFVKGVDTFNKTYQTGENELKLFMMNVKRK